MDVLEYVLIVVLMMVVNADDAGMIVNHISVIVVAVMNNVEAVAWSYVVTVAPENLVFVNIVNKKKK